MGGGPSPLVSNASKVTARKSERKVYLPDGGRGRRRVQRRGERKVYLPDRRRGMGVQRHGERGG